MIEINSNRMYRITVTGKDMVTIIRALETTRDIVLNIPNKSDGLSIKLKQNIIDEGRDINRLKDDIREGMIIIE